MRHIRLIATIGLTCAAVVPGTAEAKALGGVPAGVRAEVTQDFTFKVGHLRAPEISRGAAVRIARGNGVVRGPANGISLARTTATRAPAIQSGTAVWLVSINPKVAPVSSGGPAPAARSDRHSQRTAGRQMNWFVVAVDPYTGRILARECGYDPKLRHG